MAGLVPAIHVVLLSSHKDVDARDQRGHDGGDSHENRNYLSPMGT
jgi:hypothetical protein